MSEASLPFSGASLGQLIYKIWERIEKSDPQAVIVKENMRYYWGDTGRRESLQKGFCLSMVNEQGIMVRSTRKIKISSVFLILCVCPFAFGDIVYLKSGGEIEGKVKCYEDNKFAVEFSSGGKTAISSEQVQAVKFSEPSSKTVAFEDMLTLRKDEGSTYVLKGRIKSYEDNKFAVVSKLGEEITFSIGQVQAIEFKKVKKEKSQKTIECHEQQAPSVKIEEDKTSPKPVANYGARGPKIKGLYLGMNIEYARKQMAELLRKKVPKVGEGWVEENRCAWGFWEDSYCISAEKSDKKVRQIDLWNTWGIVDKLFNAEGLSGKEFAQAFMNAYGIPSMEPCLSLPASWRFTSPHGYEIIIFTNKSLSIKSIPKKSELKFD